MHEPWIMHGMLCRRSSQTASGKMPQDRDDDDDDDDGDGDDDDNVT